MDVFFRRFGKSKLASDQTELLDFTVRPGSIVKEAEWFSSGLPTPYIAVNPANSMLIALVNIYDSAPVVPASLAWNGKTLTRRVSIVSGYAASAIYTLTNPGAGYSDITQSETAWGIARTTTAVLLSGVHQTTPVISVGSATTQGTKTIALTTEAYGMALETGIAVHQSSWSRGYSASPPQTKISAELDYSSYLETIAATANMTRTLVLSGVSPYATMVAIALKPA